MSESMEGTWPEQNAIDKWIERHSFELKQEVTKYRISLQDELNRERRKADMMKEALELAAQEIPKLVASSRRLIDSYSLPVIKQALLEGNVEK